MHTRRTSSPGARTPLRLRTAAVLLLAALGVLLAAPAASAHDHLSAMSPAEGSDVAVLPARVSLTFDAAVGSLGSVVVVTAPDGTRLDAGRVQVRDDTISTAIQAPASPLRGQYAVSYRVVSADGHVVSARLGFALSTGASADPTVLAAPQTGSDGGGGHLSHYLIGAGLVLAAAAYLALDTVRRRR